MNPYSSILHLKKAKLTPAQESLTAAFLQLCRTKAFSAISVTELCVKAHVARTTFYASYSNTDTLLAEIEDSLIVDLLKVNRRFHRIGNVEQESTDYLNNVMTFVREHEATLTVLLVEQPDIRLIDKWKQAAKFHFWEFVSAQPGHRDIELGLEIIASMAVGAYTHLLKTKEAPGSIEEITQMLISALSALQ